jgi:hypothetical protein
LAHIEAQGAGRKAPAGKNPEIHDVPFFFFLAPGALRPF